MNLNEPNWNYKKNFMKQSCDVFSDLENIAFLVALVPRLHVEGEMRRGYSLGVGM